MRLLRLGVVCAVPLLLLACGGGGSSGNKSSSSPPDSTSPVMEDVGGLVSKGPVAGATINVYRLNEDGSQGARVAGPITTAEDGSWNVGIDAAIPRPLKVVSSGGSYTDEATGATVTAGSLNSFLPEGAETVAVTPLTDLLVQVATQRMAEGASAEDGIDAGREALSSVLAVGFDPLQVVPANPADTSGASAEQIAYAAVLGGLSQLANTVAPAADSFAVIQALVSDMTDGAIDGQAGEQAVTVGEDNLDVGTNTLAGAIADFTEDKEDFAAVTVVTAAFTEIGENGSVSPQTVDVLNGASASFTITPATGYNAIVTGCDGELVGNTYTTVALTDSCGMSVSFALNEYSVTAQASEGGSITPEQQLVLHGDITGFEVVPDIGYSIGTVEGCGGTLEGNSFTTGTITAACSVNATFVINSYTVSTDAGAGGSLSPTSASVNHGSSTTLTAVPLPGYDVVNVSGCDGTLSDNTFTTGTITADCTVSATFALRSYTVTASAGTGGSISPESVVVNHGDPASFTLTPSTGYEIAGASGCNGVLAGNTFSVASVESACNVSASFEPIMIAITTSAGSGGSISPANPQVTYGGSTSVTVTADAGYEISSVSGCGGTLSGNTFTTGTITSACTITASFVQSETPPAGAVWNEFNWDQANWQ